MTVSERGSNLGHRMFGAAALAFGIITLAWPGYDDWLRLRAIGNAENWRYFFYAAGAAQVLGGAAMQVRRSVKMGAVVLGATYFGFALLCVPHIVATPHVYDSWGNFFEQLSLATGAAIAYARRSAAWPQAKLTHIGRILLGTCAASFALEQAMHLDATANLVPKWLPPSQTSWALVTTVAFALAAAALLTNRTALLATRLLATMLVLFGILVWLPLLLSHPRDRTNWGESAETFAIAGAAWILADLLAECRRNDRTS